MTKTDIKKSLGGIPGWSYDARRKAIVTQVRCKDFMVAIRLIGKIVLLAERMDHHPDLHLTRYRRLKIVITTHSAGGVTQKDFLLAKKIWEFPPGPSGPRSSQPLALKSLN